MAPAAYLNNAPALGTRITGSTVRYINREPVLCNGRSAPHTRRASMLGGSTMTRNRQWIYARKPNAEVGPSNFDLHESDMPKPAAGDVLVKTTLLSLDPASRAWMQGATYRSQLNPGDVMAGWGLGEVVQSNADKFAPGDLVSGEFGWQEYAALPAQRLTKHDRKHK